MNKTERRYADRLELLQFNGDVASWQFEELKLRLANGCWYTPDFVVVLHDLRIEMIDVKAGLPTGKPLCKDDALVKIKCAAQQHPYRFVMTWEHQGRWVERVFGDDHD